ncbi:MAG TPA: molecular chaperone HtpG [Saprospiraceae bacterium]|nr:molecular chaperone HtpG [Saprospiraceae bacterium]
MQSGKISVQTENIFPIIKKFLYSEQEIFLRELVSNAVDACNKLKTLSSKGEFKGELGNLKIEIIPDPEAKTLTIRDNGIGMTEEEVKKYLNQLAFSSAQEFVEKYQNETSIIGHFGLGFYSAFMVADKVDVLTLSHQPNAQAVKWSCKGDTDYTIESIEKSTRGTDIILHLSEDCKDYSEQYKIETLLEKFCKFLPIPIQLGTKKEKQTVNNVETEVDVDHIINNTHPLWKKTPAELNDQDYITFYQELYPFAPEPMFWIHLNIDYPFNLTGVLYFPKIKNQLEIQKNKIHLYCNQVFVTDDVKEIVPEFLMLLHGVIDSPDIPLNVSRSYLQSDAQVRKITGYITKKVAEKLHDLYKKDRSEFEKKWDDIGLFIKYGLISDEKFAEKATQFVLLKNTDHQYFTIDEYKEKIKDHQTDKQNKLTVLYTNDASAQYSSIAKCKERMYDVLSLDQIIDNHFIQHLEYKAELHFKRVDADTIDQLIEKEEQNETVLSESELKIIADLFTSAALNKASKTELKALSPNDPPVQIVRPEFIRRMSEMQHMMHMMKGDENNPFRDQYQMIINSNHPLIAKSLLSMDEAKQQESVQYLLQLSLLENQMLKGEQLHDFIQKSISKMN